MSASMFMLQHGEISNVPCHCSSLILDEPSILAERQFLNARQDHASRKILKFILIYPHLWEVSKKRLLLHHMLALVPSRALNFPASRMHVPFVSCCSSYSLSVSSCAQLSFFVHNREFRITLPQSSQSQRRAEISGNSHCEGKSLQWTFSGR